MKSLRLIDIFGLWISENAVGEQTIVSLHVVTLVPFVWKENAP